MCTYPLPPCLCLMVCVLCALSTVVCASPYVHCPLWCVVLCVHSGVCLCPQWSVPLCRGVVRTQWGCAVAGRTWKGLI